ncbi:MAG: hypothetical protein EXR99_13645 [Gemmataceae bacterium]|nr:hypothetical protein [Gemmataceae bacterium]
MSYTLTGIYWLTGEEIESREEIRPLREFAWKNPLSNPVACQFYTRFDSQRFGDELRDNGFSFSDISTGNVNAVTLGLTWFPNRFTTLWLSWFHGMYGNEVKTGDRTTDRYDLYSARMQISY